MKNFTIKLWLILLLLTIPLTCVFGQEHNQDLFEKRKTDYSTIVQNLKELIANTPSLKTHIEESLKIQDKTSYWHNKSIDDFIKFFDEWLVENPVPDNPTKYIKPFDELANSGAGEILFNDNVFCSWFIEFLNAKGEYFDTKSSAATMDQWMSTPLIKMDDYIVPKGGFKTFNEFFLRSIKPAARPLDGKDDPSVVVSPADGAVCQIYAKDLDANFKIKRDVINIRQALNNSPYADKFVGGPVLDILLWFTDYHHFHSPVSGKIVEFGEYAGSYNYNFRDVNWYKQLAKHKRTCYVIETEEYGLVAMVPVGFWGVGSIITEPKVKVGNYIKKGEEIGHFKYGGSSILLIFEPDGIKFTLPIPVRDSGDEGIPVKIRQKIGVVATVISAAEKSHKPITQELINLLEKNPEIQNMLKASIAEAKKNNPDPKTNPVQSLSEYYDFIDRASELVPQDVLETPSLLTKDQMLQGICYFYFLVGQPLPELEGKKLFNNTIQYYEPFSSWLCNFSKTWGTFLDTKESWNEEIYQEIYNDERFGLQKGWYESPANWKTFNQFFARYLKSPEMRPIASPDDPPVVVSPADSVPQGVWAIDENSNIRVDGGLKVKLATYYSIKDLLGKDSKYKDAFANGVLTHTFLNVNDYHRYHFAVGGTIKEKKIITQNVALEVAWNKEEGKYVPIDSTGWQFSQTRGYAIVDTGKYGLAALIPMGMAQVSSVNFEENVKVGSIHKKGDMLGYFLFGGSDFIMLFQEKAGFEITAPREDETAGETTYKHILMGEKYGGMKGQAKK